MGFIESFEMRRLLSVGGLDLSFANNGIASTSLPELGSDIVSVDSSGRIYVVASENFGQKLIPANATLARFKADGTLDTSFANHGTFHVVSTNGDLNDRGEPEQFAIASDGRIAVGWTNDDPNDPLPAGETPTVKMFHTDGSPDTSFGNKGVVKFTLPPDADQFSMPIQSIVKVAFDSTGRLIVAAMEQADLLLYRFKVNGQIDTSFGNQGMTRFAGVGFEEDFMGSDFNVIMHRLLLKPDGEIYLAAGVHSIGSYGDPDFGDITQFSIAQGVIAHVDSTGHSMMTSNYDSDDPDDLYVRPDGSMLAVMEEISSAENNAGDPIFTLQSHLEGYDTQGKLATLDGQKEYVPLFLQQSVFIDGVAQLNDGRYVLSLSLGSENPGMAVLKSDFTLDDGFGDNGVLTFPPGIGSRPQILSNGNLLVSYADASSSSSGVAEIDLNAPEAPIVPVRLGIDGELIVQGTHVNDRINVQHIGEQIRVMLNGKETDFSADKVFFVTIDAARGNDFVRLQGRVPSASVLGGVGNDTILGGKGADTISGGTGNDSLRGGAGSDQIYGDGGNDTIRGDAGADTIHGSNGNDLIFGNDGSDAIIGGAGNDRIYGGDKDDFINGGDGKDSLFGDAGNDYIDGGRDADLDDGGDGYDVVILDRSDKILNAESN